MNKYACVCIVPRCKFSIEVEAESSKEAVEKMIKGAESHLIEAHPEMPVLDDEKIRECIKSNIKKME